MFEYPLHENESWRRCHWESKEAQYKRFEILCGVGDVEGKQIFDIGCGDGELYAYLNERYENVIYRGVDINFAMIEKAHVRFNKERHRFFWAADESTSLSWAHLGAPPDYVLASGLFNIESGDNDERAIAFLQKAFSIAKIGIAVNFLWDGYAYRHPDFHMFNWQKMAQEALTFCQNIDVRLGYLPNDFTLYMRR